MEIFVDGNSIGSTTANGNGDFSFTPTTPLAPGEHEAFVGATDAAGNDSPPSNTNGFRIDTDDPAAPAITSPPDGGTTTDPTPTITGTAEPGSQVLIIVDGEQVGSTTADEDGKFSFTLPDALSLGEHVLRAIAVDAAGNRSDASDPVSFGVLAASAGIGQGLGSDRRPSRLASGSRCAGSPGRFQHPRRDPMEAPQQPRQTLNAPLKTTLS